MNPILLKLIFNKYTLFLVLISALALSLNHSKNLKAEKERAEKNATQLLNQKEGETVDLKLTVKELKTYLEKEESLRRILEDSLDIKSKHIKELTRALSSTKIKIETYWKDTTIYDVDTVRTLRSFDYQDPWTRIQGVDYLNKLSITYSSTDTLYFIDYKYKNGKWFLPKLFEKFKTTRTVKNTNPNNTYHIDQNIKITKKDGSSR